MKGLVGRSSNVRELEVAASLISKGFKVYKKGWPDFLAFHPETEEVILVEVKYRHEPSAKLVGAQRAMREILSKKFRFKIACFPKRGGCFKIYK